MTGPRLRVNPILCDAYGHCAELLPELVRADEWGYPIVSESAVPDELLDEARRTVAACPRLALFVEQAKDRVAPESASQENPIGPLTRS
jgi:ferredoxin